MNTGQAILILFFSLFISTESLNYESLILTNLTSNYNQLVRPVDEVSSVLNCSLALTILQLIEVDEKHQTITLNANLALEWNDVHLKWDKEEFGNLSTIHIPANLIWKPDIDVYTKAQMDNVIKDKMDGYIAIVKSSGEVYLTPSITIQIACPMNIAWFPFDKQECTLQLGSWVYNGLELDVDVNQDRMPLQYYFKNGEWEIVSLTGKRDVQIYPCCPEPYPSVKFSIKMKRRSLYYVFFLVVPSGMIGFLALLGFTLSPDSSEKMTLGASLLFSVIIFLTTISGMMPANSDGIPFLAIYLNCVMLNIAASVVSTVIVNLKIRTTISKWGKAKVMNDNEGGGQMKMKYVALWVDRCCLAISLVGSFVIFMCF